MARRPDASRRLADEELMELARRGDARAFELIVERHERVAFSLAYRMSGDRATAEDIVQDAMLSLWRSNARYEPSRGSVRTWVLGIVHHRAVDALRRGNVHARRRASDEGIEERFAAPEHTEGEVARREQAGELRDALAALPADQRRVLELAHFGGFTHVEIAEMLRLPLGTVKGRMRLGLVRMRDALAAQGTT